MKITTYQDEFPYQLAIPYSIVDASELIKMILWCHDTFEFKNSVVNNYHDSHHNSYHVFHFKKEEDKNWFILRWGSNGIS